MPPSASSTLPGLRETAPVKAPFSCPNSSLSRSPSGIAAQLIATSGPAARLLARWTACATSSFPVPLSPRTRIVASEAAARTMRSPSSRILGEVPIMPWRAPDSSSRMRSRCSRRSTCRTVSSASPALAAAAVTNWRCPASKAPPRAAESR